MFPSRDLFSDRPRVAVPEIPACPCGAHRGQVSSARSLNEFAASRQGTYETVTGLAVTARRDLR
jgi:hypothetical protein